MANPVVFESKMSDAEALMWRMELDPYLSSTFANVTVLDRPIDAPAFRRRMERATWMVRRLRQRVQQVPANLSPPTWVDDPEFDIAYHVRHISLPKPGTLRQLLDVATMLAGDAFDRTRPLWQFYVVDGLRGGKGALVQKMHHTIADGEASLAMSLQFLDFERGAPEPAPLDPAMMADAAAEADSRAGATSSAGDMLRDLAVKSLRLQLGMAKQLKEFAATPSSLGSAGASVREIVHSAKHPPQTRSTLWTDRSLRRRLEVLDIPLASTKRAAKSMGGTLNTAFLTAAAAASGEYHRRLGAPVESLSASMAISTRNADSGANAFSLARFTVPTGEMPIADRFAAVLAATSEAKSASAGLDGLAALVAALPTPLLAHFARQQSQAVDFATSNVRAAPVKVYIGGAEILSNYPAGPLVGVAFNATLMSYCGRLDIGVNCDAAAITDPPLLGACLSAAFKELARQR